MAERSRPPITESLLQELLLALLGFFGNIFVDNRSKSSDRTLAEQQIVPDSSGCTVRVADYVHWVDAPDRCARRQRDEVFKFWLIARAHFGNS